MGEEPFFGNRRRFRALDVVPFEEEDESSFVGLLQVEAELQSLKRTLQAPFAHLGALTRCSNCGTIAQHMAAACGPVFWCIAAAARGEEGRE